MATTFIDFAPSSARLIAITCSVFRRIYFSRNHKVKRFVDRQLVYCRTATFEGGAPLECSGGAGPGGRHSIAISPMQGSHHGSARRSNIAVTRIALDCASGERGPSCGPGWGLMRDDDIGPVRRRALPHGERFCYKKAWGEKPAARKRDIRVQYAQASGRIVPCQSALP
jgi:hypothetical protein